MNHSSAAICVDGQPVTDNTPATPPPADLSLTQALSAAQKTDGKAKRSPWRLIGIVASLLLFGVAFYVLYVTIRDLNPDDLRKGFAEASWQQIGFAVFFTALSYLMLTGYDVLALRQIKANFIRYRTAAFASFTSYAISFTLGFPLITAGAVRFWVYAPKGLSAQKIASLTLIAAVTFWLGMGLVMGFSLVTRPEAIAEINRLAVSVNQMIGIAVLGAAVVYFAWVAAKPRHIRFQGWRLSLPTAKVTVGQMALGWRMSAPAGQCCSCCCRRAMVTASRPFSPSMCLATCWASPATCRAVSGPSKRPSLWPCPAASRKGSCSLRS